MQKLTSLIYETRKNVNHDMKIKSKLKKNILEIRFKDKLNNCFYTQS
jgi:hypothetical protein